MNLFYLFVALIALSYLWSLSVKRQVVKHHQHRTTHHKATFSKPTTPPGGVSAHH